MVMRKEKSESEENPESKELMKKQWEKMLISETVGRFLRKKGEQRMSQQEIETSNF